MHKKLKSAYKSEMIKGKRQFSAHRFEAAFEHFERAHVLGQLYVIPHARTHIWMLFLGIRTRNSKEIVGQMIRIPLGMIGSALGKVPLGNTGGANVRLSSKMPIPDDLKAYLDPENEDGSRRDFQGVGGPHPRS